MRHIRRWLLELGVDADRRFRAGSRRGLRAGHLVVLGTDGLWEARDLSGGM
jgi:hypothetical protein